MSLNDTICEKITQSIEDLESAMHTGNLDIFTIVKRLHRIREQAQKMETGLKRRKKIMIREGLEDEYQALKKKLSIPEGVNKIYNEGEEVLPEKLEFEFIIKREGEVIYQNKAHSAVLSIVEKVDDIDEMGNITGVTQKFICGNPMMIWFAFDQLKIAVEARRFEILGAIKEAIKNRKFSDPEIKKKFIDAINK